MPMAKGRTVPSSAWPSHSPVAKASTAVPKPASADASPAALGNGPAAPAWPQGWCTPWPSAYSHTGSITAHTERASVAASTAKATQAASEKPAARPTAPASPSSGIQRRHSKVPAM